MLIFVSEIVDSSNPDNTTHSAKIKPALTKAEKKKKGIVMGNLGSTVGSGGGMLTQSQLEKYRNAIEESEDNDNASSKRRTKKDKQAKDGDGADDTNRVSAGGSSYYLKEQVNDEQIEELREHFAIFDLNCSGWIEESDLKEALQILGQPKDNYEVRKLMQSIDTSKDGRISFDEYIEWNRQLFIDDMKMKFRKMDSEGKKIIGKQEIKKFAMDELGYMATEEELDELTYAMDYNQDGWIEIEEFIIAMANAKQGQAYYVYNGELYRRKMKADFKAIDLDGDGYVCKNELREMANTLGYEITEEELDALMDDMDDDKNGRIDFQEFVAHTVRDVQQGSNDVTAAKDC